MGASSSSQSCARPLSSEIPVHPVKAAVFAFFKEHTKQQVNKVDLGLRLEIAIRRAS